MDKPEKTGIHSKTQRRKRKYTRHVPVVHRGLTEPPKDKMIHVPISEKSLQSVWDALAQRGIYINSGDR